MSKADIINMNKWVSKRIKQEENKLKGGYVMLAEVIRGLPFSKMEREVVANTIGVALSLANPNFNMIYWDEACTPDKEKE